MKRQMTRKIHAPWGVSAIAPVASEKFEYGDDHDLAAADLVRQPAVEQRPKGRADAGGEQDHPRLAIGQVASP